MKGYFIAKYSFVMEVIFKHMLFKNDNSFWNLGQTEQIEKHLKIKCRSY